MCNLSQGVWEKGNFERGLSDVRNLMEGINCSVEKAMSILKVPDKDRQAYIALLEEEKQK